MANLPADLPEDWTSNQKISPNGTEVGLSEQHGYNYLMKQVNDAQNEINNIGTTIEAALEDVAKEASVQEIITSIGETDDTGGSTVAGTVMGKLNNLIDQDSVQSNKLDTLLTILGSGVAEFTTAGKHSVTIPAGITKLKITACGGGGGGGGFTFYSTGSEFPSYIFAPSGGSGGCSIVDKKFSIPNTGSETIINITVGAGGAGATGANGKNGGSTIIGNIVTLPGGKGGISKQVTITSKTPVYSDVTASSGEGSGAGAAGVIVATGYDDSLVSFSTEKGSDGAISNTGGNKGTGQVSAKKTKYAFCLGGPGGGSLGKGGNSGKIIADSTGDITTFTRSTAGTRGGGGAGATAYDYYGSSGSDEAGKAGGTGYVKIEWGL